MGLEPAKTFLCAWLLVGQYARVGSFIVCSGIRNAVDKNEFLSGLIYHIVDIVNTRDIFGTDEER